MARYAIGDIHGCFVEFCALLKQVNFDPQYDRLFSVGDIVNRGPDSLAVLRWLYEHRHAVHMVLGNHEIYLLGISAGCISQQPQDTLDPILQAEDKNILLDWLRKQPLFSLFDGFCLIHAGVWPGWSLAEVKQFAHEAETALQSEDFPIIFPELYTESPIHWTYNLSNIERLRFITNSMTRMRALHLDDKSLDFRYKGLLDQMPSNLAPWFKFTQQSDIPRIICGHWSALPLQLTKQVWSLDTGCVWGKHLTLVNCDSGEIFQQKAL